MIAPATSTVADTGIDRIQKFTTDGQFVLAWGTRGSEVGQFKYPCDVAVDASGNVYVSDEQNQRIHKFSPTGNPITMWGSVGSGNGQFGSLGPQGLGGRITALAVHVNMIPCHIASFPLAVNINCHAHRTTRACSTPRRSLGCWTRTRASCR